MALYLGGDEIKRKVILNNIVYYFKLFTSTPMTNGIRLLSSDNYTLKDTDGLYLTAKEDN